MRVFLQPDAGLSRAITRVADALIRHKPEWVEIVDTAADAEFQIWHVLGDGQRKPIIAGQGPRRYAVIQYCVRSTETPHTRDWANVWRDAEVVWSYYDLRGMLRSDGIENWLAGNIYHQPLGVESIFTDRQRPRRFLVGTSGYVAATEGIEEWARVCHQTGYPQFHLGPRELLIAATPGSIVGSGMDDDQLAELWSQCSYIAAMRRVEGFEFPGIEGLCCGARPVCFDRPHYRQWYGPMAEYVVEGSVDETTQALIDLVSRPYRRVKTSERICAARTFDWTRLCTGFWNEIPRRGKHR